MSLKSQLKTLKENWLIVAIVIVAFFMFTSSPFKTFDYFVSGGSYAEGAPAYHAEKAFVGDSFAPEVEERKITKTASLSTEVKYGEFDQAVSQVKAAVRETNAFLLNENINTYDSGRRQYRNGYYSIKVEVSKYDQIVSKLKQIGEVKSFNENTEDITGRYTDIKVEYEAEKERLARYKTLYNEATSVEDKLNLNDRIFDQERRVKYLEDELLNIDKRVEYSTISLTVSEKRSEYADIVFVKLSELVSAFVSSVNSLLTLIFVVLPYAIAVAIIWLVVKKLRK